MSAEKHVLFVCTGNTCRSPMAEGLLRKMVSESRGNRGIPGILVGSAGLAASRGAGASRETLAVLKKRSAELAGFRSRQVTRDLLAKATHVFAMTSGHLETLEGIFPEFSGKYHLVGEFAPGADRRGAQDVQDPIGMGAAAYEEVATFLESAMPTLIAYVQHQRAK